MIEKIKNYIAILFLSIGIILNPFILEKITSPQAYVGLKYKIPISLISFTLVLIGIIFLLIKINSDSIKKIIEYYKLTAVTLLSTLILFIFANVFCLIYYGTKDLMFYQNFIFSKYKKPLDYLYPGFNKSEVNQILHESWIRPYVYEPYTQFKESVFHGKYVNVHDFGFRFVKNQGPWPPDKANFNIFIFGGSTTFNYGLPDYQTIPSYLQEFLQGLKLNKKVFIYNFCQGYYFSSQECIFLKKLITLNYIPNAVIFVDGLNEFYQAKDEPLYTEKLKNVFKGKEGFVLNLPIIKLISEAKSKKANDINHYTYDPQEIDTIINRYLINKKIIEAICNRFSVDCFFVWQPVPTYKYNLKYHPFSDGGFGKHSLSRFGYKVMESYFKNGKLGNNFLWLGNIQEDVKKSLYVDKYHYTAEMSKEIAKRIYSFVKDKIQFQQPVQ